MSPSTPLNMERTQPVMRLHLLGLPCADLDAGPVPLGASRTAQLLAYLAARGTWQGRDDVARLFWPDRPPKIAYSNLRNLLCKAAVAAPFAPIEATAHALRLQVPSDLNDFETAVLRGDSEVAVRIGSGELLSGFDIHASEPYLLWLQSARAAQLAQWTKAVQAMLAQTARPPEHRQILAEAWGSRCPYEEDAVRAQMSIAIERFQSDSAVTIFRAFKERVLTEFGVGPSHALECFALADTHISATSMPRASVAPPAPSETRPRLFGRRLELGQLKSLLADDAVRLVTLTGPGGVGKSTLLAALFEQNVADGQAGACLVDASAAQNAQAVVAAIAAAMGIEGLQGAGNELALAATLRDRRCLLMIDGAEQPGLAGPLAHLIERCPQTRLLVAARSRLALDDEHVVMLDGFPLPDADESDEAVLGNNDGVRYFVDVMRQAGQQANLARDASTLAALVHAVEGLPLALKLLAKLTRVFSLPQLLSSVREQMAGARQSGSPELDELMPALVASFERSWAALAPAEQAVLARLAVFPAAFDVAAARAVANTELPLIISLVDRSLVRAASAGRLSVHAGIRACVLAACPMSESAIGAYLQFYTQQLARLADMAKVKTVRPRNLFLRNEGDHVEHTWRLALDRRDYAALLCLAESLCFQVQAVGCVGDYRAWFVEAEHVLHDDLNAPSALRALLLAGAARAAHLEGKVEMAVGQARQALREAQRARHRDAQLFALSTLSMLSLVQNNLDEAEAMLEQVAALRGETGEAYSGIGTVNITALSAFLRSGLEQCLAILDHAISLSRGFEDSSAVVSGLVNKATICSESGDLSRAVEFLYQAIDEAGATDASPALKVAALCDAALLHLEAGDLAQSRACTERANALAFSRSPPPLLYLRIQIANAAVTVASGQVQLAAKWLIELLDVIGRGEMAIAAPDTFLVAAQWFRLAGDRNACLSMIRGMGERSIFYRRCFDSAQAMLRELGQEPQPRAEDPARKSTPEVATCARLRMLTLLDKMQRSERLQDSRQEH